MDNRLILRTSEGYVWNHSTPGKVTVALAKQAPKIQWHIDNMYVPVHRLRVVVKIRNSPELQWVMFFRAIDYLTFTEEEFIRHIQKAMVNLIGRNLVGLSERTIVDQIGPILSRYI